MRIDLVGLAELVIDAGTLPGASAF